MIWGILDSHPVWRFAFFPLGVLAINRALDTPISRRESPGMIRMWSDLRLLAKTGGLRFLYLGLSVSTINFLIMSYNSGITKNTATQATD